MMELWFHADIVGQVASVVSCHTFHRRARHVRDTMKLGYLILDQEPSSFVMPGG
jgi:hypothetical protein